MQFKAEFFQCSESREFRDSELEFVHQQHGWTQRGGGPDYYVESGHGSAADSIWFEDCFLAKGGIVGEGLAGDCRPSFVLVAAKRGSFCSAPEFGMLRHRGHGKMGAGFAERFYGR